MKIVIQRVRQASVTINDETVSQIPQGMLILLGIAPDDTEEDILWLTRKIVSLRIFDDDQGVMNLHITHLPEAQILVVSQFTLMASTRKGNRPSYINAAPPQIAQPIYEKFVAQLEHDFGKPVQTGRFGADMKVSLINDGPVTIIIDSKNRI